MDQFGVLHLIKNGKGDIYIDDGIHYHLSVEAKVLVTTEIEYHISNKGQWWWKGREPKDLPIDKKYYE
jgi:hypothetical protein